MVSNSGVIGKPVGAEAVANRCGHEDLQGSEVVLAQVDFLPVKHEEVL